MKELTHQDIWKHLAEIENEHCVTVLLAVESGSRAWGFSSPDSDWDVRFIYVHHPSWYFKVMPQRDVIERMYDDGMDASGWELRKALQLFRKINPSMIEWLHSPIVYLNRNDLKQRLLAIEPHFFLPLRGIYHYYSLARKQKIRYLEKQGCTLKRFLYYLRALLACDWIMHSETSPPVPFLELVEATVSDEEIRKEITQLVALKSQSKEHDRQFVSHLLYNYARAKQQSIDILLQNYRETKQSQNYDAELDQLLLDMMTWDD